MTVPEAREGDCIICEEACVVMTGMDLVCADCAQSVHAGIE